MAEAKPMHDDFARWYGAVSMGDDVARREARWGGVIKVVANAKRATVEALLRLAHDGRAAPAPATVLEIRQAFKDADQAFEMNDNPRELQVLAGACLVVLMEDLTEDEGAAAALAATTAGLGGARKPDLPMDLAALGEVAIDQRSEAVRKRPSLTEQLSPEPPKFDFEKAAARVKEKQTWDGVAEGFAIAADATRAGMSALARRQAMAIRATARFIRVQDEELQTLWWLIGQRSETYDCAFDAIPAAARPFVLASELANSTQFLPGPPSVKGILSRAGLEQKKVAVTAAVNAPRSQFLKDLLGGVDPSPVSTPLHFAVKRQLETGPGPAWVAGWAGSSNIDSKHALPGLMLGELFYRERLLLLK